MKTNWFKKISKKYSKKETEPYNPWAVCTESVGRDDEDKYEKCVMGNLPRGKPPWLPVPKILCQEKK